MNSSKKAKTVWRRLFGFKLRDRVKILKVAWEEQEEFIGKKGVIVDILGKGIELIKRQKEFKGLGEQIGYAVQLDEFDEGERIWVAGDWLEIA